jgi:hypothetical protein
LTHQPPADRAAGNASLYHYTWGATYLDANKNAVWSWDKVRSIHWFPYDRIGVVNADS